MFYGFTRVFFIFYLFIFILFFIFLFFYFFFFFFFFFFWCCCCLYFSYFIGKCSNLQWISKFNPLFACIPVDTPALRIHLVDCYNGDHVCDLLFCFSVHPTLLKRVYYKRKESASLGNKFFPFTVDAGKTNLSILPLTPPPAPLSHPPLKVHLNMDCFIT